MKTKGIIAVIIAAFAVSSLASCSSTQECWAYRSTQVHKNYKNRPSIAAAKGATKAKIKLY